MRIYALNLQLFSLL